MKEGKIQALGLELHYGGKHALKNICLEIRGNAVTALIGPSGCGKSTFLKCINRMNDLVDGVKIEKRGGAGPEGGGGPAAGGGF